MHMNIFLALFSLQMRPWYWHQLWKKYYILYP